VEITESIRHQVPYTSRQLIAFFAVPLRTIFYFKVRYICRIWVRPVVALRGLLIARRCLRREQSLRWYRVSQTGGEIPEYSCFPGLRVGAGMDFSLRSILETKAGAVVIRTLPRVDLIAAGCGVGLSPAVAGAR
jgi:hypothetical protein